MDENGSTTPATFVQIGTPEGWLASLSGSKLSLDPRTASVLSAVILASAEQVSAPKLATFGVSSALDLSMLGLAMSFRDDDSGLVGDVFEWSVLLAANGADGKIAQLLSDALTLSGVQLSIAPQAVLVAAERGRLVQYSPDLPVGAALATGRRGRPPHVANLLASADTRNWKADLLLGAEEKWVATSLKSNPFTLVQSLKAAAKTPHPPRIGVTASEPQMSGVTRDPETGVVIVKVPVDAFYLSLSKAVLVDVRAAFARHLSLPRTPLQQDASGIGLQLNRWQHHTVRDALAILNEVAGEASLLVGDVRSTGASIDDSNGALVASNSLEPSVSTVPLSAPGVSVNWLLDFDPVD